VCVEEEEIFQENQEFWMEIEITYAMKEIDK